MQIFVRDKKFYKATLKIAVPIVLQSMITIGVNMIDTLMVGTLGEIPLSGSSLANEFINLFHILCMGMGGGAAVLTSQYWGAKDIPSFKKVTTIMLRLCLAIAAVFTAFTIIAPETIMRMYTNDEAIIVDGVRYFRYSAFAYIPLGIALCITQVLRSCRSVKLPLITSIVAFFANIFINWVLIFGKLGFPEMGIEGAALATLLVRIMEMAIIGGYFMFVDKKIGYRVKDLFDKCSDYIKRYITFGIPVLISDALLGVGNMMMTVIVGHIGASFVAANAIIAQITRMSTVFTQGVSNASGILTGNTLGTGDKKKAYDQGITFLALSVLVGIVAAIVILTLTPIVLSGYTLEAETMNVANQLMWAVAIMVVFQCVQAVLTKGVLRGGGDTKFLMLADVLFLWLASIPLGYLAGLVFHLPAFWVYAALKTDWIIKSVWCTIRLLKGNWMKKTV